MPVRTLDDLLLYELRDLYDAEQRIVKALPKMAKAASNPQLQAAFEDHLEQTEEHVRRLEEAFSMLSEEPRKKTCEGIKGLLEEGEEVLKADMEDHVRDAALIAAAQRVEHYEMAGYGSARAFARTLGYHDVEDVLQETLDEEGEADHRLTQIAEAGVNMAAVA